jgi:hypothetical protein
MPTNPLALVRCLPTFAYLDPLLHAPRIPLRRCCYEEPIFTPASGTKPLAYATLTLKAAF